MRLSPWIDAPVPDSARASIGATAREGWMTATVVAVDAGTLEMTFEGAPEDAGTVVVPVTGGVWSAGARVRVLVDSSGRVVWVDAPLSVPDGETVVPVGPTAERAVAAEQSAAEVKATAAQIAAEVAAAQQTMVDLDAALTEATTDLAQSVGTLDARVTAAQAGADAAQESATTALGEVTVHTRNPTASDAAGKPEGALWWVKPTGSLAARLYTLVGGQWLQIRMGTDLIGNGAITGEKVHALSVAARVGEFLQIKAGQIVAGGVIASNLLAADITGKNITGSTVTVSNAGSLIALRKSVSGKPEIVVQMSNGDRSVLDTDGLTYWSGGQLVGSQSWRSLISPPFAVLTWPESYGVNAPPRSYWTLGVNEASQSLHGGMTVDGAWLKVPISGWYHVEVACGFRWETTQAGWAVATSVWRQQDHAANLPPRDLEDPAMTLALIPGVTTRPVATGVMQLDAGSKIAPCFWQNTGAWKPNSGTSRMIVRLIDEL